MGYDCNYHRLESVLGDQLHDAEWEVIEALKQSGYGYDEAHITSWVPTEVLYRAYRTWIGTLKYREPESETLNPEQFGAALRRVFPFEPDDHLRRKFHGRRLWGYARVTGPEAVEVREVRAGPGRPHANPDDEWLIP